MAKDTVRMPQSTAGITSFGDQSTSTIQITPIQVVVIIVIMVILVALLHLFGRTFI